jgi:UDP-N-acetylmuramate dehydrogenase
MDEKSINLLRQTFNDRLQENVHMANFTTMNIGGKADALLIVHTAVEMENYVNKLWELEFPYIILGSGSNVLISDYGIREVVLINHAHNLRINSNSQPASVWAESGANLAQVGRQTALRGLSGLEWASAIPGTIGGAVYGNAGAFKKDISCNFLHAEILHRIKGKQIWEREQFAYSYRSSILKKEPQEAVILSATLGLEKGEPEMIKSLMEENRQRRMKTQPLGPSMGSVFRNPEGDKAGRLIEAAGLKGKKNGGAEISSLHANFIINTGNAHAQDVLDLILQARQAVETNFGIHLIPEIQIIGEWDQKYQAIIHAINTGSES